MLCHETERKLALSQSDSTVEGDMVLLPLLGGKFKVMALQWTWRVRLIGKENGKDLQVELTSVSQSGCVLSWKCP